MSFEIQGLTWTSTSLERFSTVKYWIKWGSTLNIGLDFLISANLLHKLGLVDCEMKGTVTSW